VGLKPKFSARTKAKAIARVGKGESYKAVADDIGADKNTVRTWCDAAGVRSDAANARTNPKRTTPAPEPEAVEPDPLDESLDESLDETLREMVRQLRWTREQAKLAAADGNNAAASKLNRDAAGLANTIARIKADQVKSGGEGSITVSAERLKAVRDQVVDMFDRMARSPEGSLGLCPNCGAEVRMARASAEPGKDSL
jgi:transposase-like protein